MKYILYRATFHAIVTQDQKIIRNLEIFRFIEI